MQMARDGWTATAYCFGAWPPPRAAAVPWRAVAAAAAHAAVCLEWARFSHRRFARATTRAVLTHLFAAARSCGLADTHSVMLQARALCMTLDLQAGRLERGLLLGEQLLESYEQVCTVACLLAYIEHVCIVPCLIPLLAEQLLESYEQVCTLAFVIPLLAEQLLERYEQVFSGSSCSSSTSRCAHGSGANFASLVKWSNSRSSAALAPPQKAPDRDRTACAGVPANVPTPRRASGRALLPLPRRRPSQQLLGVRPGRGAHPRRDTRRLRHAGGAAPGPLGHARRRQAADAWHPHPPAARHDVVNFVCETFATAVWLAPSLHSGLACAAGPAELPDRVLVR